MKKTVVLRVVLGLLFCNYWVSPGLAALETREDRIARELECASRQMQRQEGVNWNDICLTADKSEQAMTVDSFSKAVAAEKNTPGAKDSHLQLAQAPAAGAGTASAKLPMDLTTGSPKVSSMNYKATEDEEKSPLYNFFDPENPLNKMDVGIEWYAYTYEEPDFAKLSGPMMGIFSTYTHRFHQNNVIRSMKDVFSATSGLNMLQADAYFSYGKLDYESNGSGEDPGEPNYVYRLKLVAGWDLPFSETFRVTPYAGFGYRYLLDASGGRITDAGYYGYDRESTYAYLPLGMEVEKTLSSLVLSARVEYDVFIDGTQKSHLGDAVAGLNTVKNDQNHGYGMEASFRVTQKTKLVNLFVEPFVRYWKINDSDISTLTYSGVAVGYGLEPENKTTEYGTRVGVQF